MTEQFVVHDHKNRVIESGFPTKKAAKEFAADFRKLFHCKLPLVVATALPLRPGDSIK